MLHRLSLGEIPAEKGAIKLHVGLDADGQGARNQQDQKLETPQRVPLSALIAASPISRYSDLPTNAVFFVSRLKSNADVRYLLKQAGRKSPGNTSDQDIRLKGVEQPLPLVVDTDPATGIESRIVTNTHHHKAREIAESLQKRWQIDFFQTNQANPEDQDLPRHHKQRGIDSSWIALCVDIVLAYLKFNAKLGSSMQQIPRLLQRNLFASRDSIELFKPPSIQFTVSP